MSPIVEFEGIADEVVVAVIVILVATFAGSVLARRRTIQGDLELKRKILHDIRSDAEFISGISEPAEVNQAGGTCTVCACHLSHSLCRCRTDTKCQPSGAEAAGSSSPLPPKITDAASAASAQSGAPDATDRLTSDQISVPNEPNEPDVENSRETLRQRPQSVEIVSEMASPATDGVDAAGPTAAHTSVPSAPPDPRPHAAAVHPTANSGNDPAPSESAPANACAQCGAQVRILRL
jgi:hypothetical protein